MARGRILAVDDQRYFRELIEGLLVDEGYRVQSCASGEEALRLLEQSAYDLIITDLVMPSMTGTELVHRLKERDPDQDILVVTGVVEVQSAVEAMKVGATDYLVKPFDRATLATTVKGILQRSRLRLERDRLLAENIEYLSERSLFERALGLFQATSLEVLSEKVLDGLCRETGAQGGVLWWRDEESEEALRLVAVHGLVRIDEEPQRQPEAELPRALRDEGAVTALATAEDDEGTPRPALWVALRRRGALLGAIRLNEKIGDDAFDDVDRTYVEKFVGYAETAYRNAERFRALERQTLQDPETGAYRLEVLRDLVRNEIEKADRFGRRFGLLAVSVDPIAPLRQRLGEGPFHAWQQTFVRHLSRLLRATDLLAVGGEGRFVVMLPESDAIGVASFKQRTREALERGEALVALRSGVRPEVNLGCVSYPADASGHESLFRALEARLDEDRRARARERDFAAQPLAAALANMVEGSACESHEGVASLLRFAVSEVGRRPRERNLLFCRPGTAFAPALAEGLRQRRDVHSDTDLVVLGDPPDSGADERVTWLRSDALEGAPPFAVYFGDGPAYVLVADDEAGAAGPRLFHSSERALAETLAFRLQRELRVPRLG